MTELICMCVSVSEYDISKHLGAGSRKECMLTIVKAFGMLVRFSLQHSGGLGWFQVWCSNVFSREASVISFITHCDCGPLSNISAPQLDPWSFLPLLFPVHFPPSPFLHTCPSNHGWSWLMVTWPRPVWNALLLRSEPRELWLVRHQFQVIFFTAQQRLKKTLQIIY